MKRKINYHWSGQTTSKVIYSGIKPLSSIFLSSTFLLSAVFLWIAFSINKIFFAMRFWSIWRCSVSERFSLFSDIRPSSPAGRYEKYLIRWYSDYKHLSEMKKINSPHVHQCPVDWSIFRCQQFHCRKLKIKQGEPVLAESEHKHYWFKEIESITFQVLNSIWKKEQYSNIRDDICIIETPLKNA